MNGDFRHGDCAGDLELWGFSLIFGVMRDRFYMGD